MNDKEQDVPWYQFHKKFEYGRLEIETNGGFAPDGIGLSITIEKPPFYYAVFAFRLLIVCLFFDMIVFWGEEPLVEDGLAERWTQ